MCPEVYFVEFCFYLSRRSHGYQGWEYGGGSRAWDMSLAATLGLAVGLLYGPTAPQRVSLYIPYGACTH